MTELSLIAQNYLTDKGCTYFNSHCYTEIYNSYFQKLKNKNRKVYILEIGVQAGYDLLMMNDYFEGNCEIYGFDININTLEVELPDNIHIFELNAASIPELNKFYSNLIHWSVNKMPQFDIIIDDGSHESQDILTSLYFFYLMLSYDGIYIIEDLHAESAKEALNYLTFNESNNINMDDVTKNIQSKTIHYICNSYCIDYDSSICAVLTFKK